MLDASETKPDTRSRWFGNVQRKNCEYIRRNVIGASRKEEEAVGMF